MARTFENCEETVFVLSNKEAVDLIALLSAQLGNTYIYGHYHGACPIFNIEQTKENTKHIQSLVFLIEPNKTEK